jgi:E3 ubiquitin-protein ligase RHF
VKGLNRLHFQIPVGADDAELEEHIIQHLTAVAAMCRSRRHHRRDGHHSRSGANSHLQILVLPTDEVTLDGSMRSTFSQEENHEHSPSIVRASYLATVVEQERTTRASDNTINSSLHRSTPDSTDGSNNKLVLHPTLQCLCWFPLFGCYW